MWDVRPFGSKCHRNVLYYIFINIDIYNWFWDTLIPTAQDANFQQFWNYNPLSCCLWHQVYNLVPDYILTVNYINLFNNNWIVQSYPPRWVKLNTLSSCVNTSVFFVVVILYVWYPQKISFFSNSLFCVMKGFKIVGLMWCTMNSLLCHECASMFI